MITLTESAINRVRDMMTKRESGIGLRIGVVKSGCSGYSYALDYADELGNGDVILEQSDVKVVVNEEAMPLLEGMELDFVKEGLNQSFKFRNPNVTSECGCGESFSVTK
ncbi:Iron binding protein IscA for iron-sulfur cluster assembly [Methylophaga thiooxydans]|uniref:HesB-like domain, putative n=2 Tax=Methylophaga thiooxydans TaxID=392484 RepID=C0N7Q1_9GAMM|nr:iron-sulfur cluster assembly accessory protein [Methylophaga thiooxydans]EEF79382.1 HesB-like domain, putative [Methylophaga thiooxydans DMS010]KGM07052.1 Iron binding protein IscA for iron-sulfur cluster assembly [Methylophaga thiooxydans]|mmetsp:Transcript_16147/g.20722  ORF Transcript_16147/g.20722 Transcript_16147/m.20722 type:complete len:109 (+) Transcript_16147:117-443(+)